MIVLFEDFQYRTENLKPVLGERYYLPINSTYSKISYVGYYFNPLVNEGKGDVVIILPKVFIDVNDLAFGKYAPEQLINPNEELIEEINLSGKSQFIFEISTWLYRAIHQYNKRRSKNIISENQYINNVVTNLDSNSTTELDIILSMLEYYKNNKQLFLFIAKTSHSQINKINWNKTINSTTPIIKNNKPIYLNLKTTTKRINDDEELLIIFYSTLNFIKDKYFFEFSLPQNYDLIKDKQFEKFIQKGCRNLKKIKYKYFSDRMKEMYRLLYMFFERSEKAKNNKLKEEVLLIRDFHIVFEDMVDDLISDQNIPSKLKNHMDGKEVDHIYRDASFFAGDDIYFIGDSKYYKAKSNIGVLSKAKQFTYAKNVIQFNIDLFNKNRLEPGLRYRDSDTEGYNVTPNFFISAMLNNDLNFCQSDLENTNTPLLSFHFENRLFDRDTLILQSYRMNFLFLLSCYITKNQLIKDKFKKEARLKFRNELVGHLEENYEFYKIYPLNDYFIQENFKLLNGKIYKPSSLDSGFILALEKKPEHEKENLSIISLIHAEIEYKYIEKYQLSDFA